jgi:hypothetical protein
MWRIPHAYNKPRIRRPRSSKLLLQKLPKERKIMAEEWTEQDEAKWQAIQPLIRKRARIYMKQRRDNGRVRRYSRSENKSSLFRNKQAKEQK